MNLIETENKLPRLLKQRTLYYIPEIPSKLIDFSSPYLINVSSLLLFAGKLNETQNNCDDRQHTSKRWANRPHETRPNSIIVMVFRFPSWYSELSKIIGNNLIITKHSLRKLHKLVVVVMEWSLTDTFGYYLLWFWLFFNGLVFSFLHFYFTSSIY